MTTISTGKSSVTPYTTFFSTYSGHGGYWSACTNGWLILNNLPRTEGIALFVL